MKKVLSFKQLRERGVRFSRVHLGRLMAADKFPKPIALGGNSIAWVEDEVDAWLEARIVERDAKPTATPQPAHAA
jgi:prophage regulatory protein